MNNDDVYPAIGFSFDNETDRPISNEEFLRSYIRLGVWLRHSLAFDQIKILSEESENFQRFAATAHFYSAFSAQMEDVSSMLLALICWERKPTILLADALFQIGFQKATIETPSAKYIEHAVEKILSGKKTQVDITCLGLSFQALGSRKVLEMVGMPWKKQPSVKLAKGKQQLAFWEILPDAFDDNILDRIASHDLAHLRVAYNKIKHGPQIVISDFQSLLQSLGGDEAGVQAERNNLRERNVSSEALRILFEGGHTAWKDKSRFSPTLFLDDDVSAVKSVFARVVHPKAKWMWILVNWICQRKLNFTDFNSLPKYFEKADLLAHETRAYFQTASALAKISASASIRNI